MQARGEVSLGHPFKHPDKGGQLVMGGQGRIENPLVTVHGIARNRFRPNASQELKSAGGSVQIQCTDLLAATQLRSTCRLNSFATHARNQILARGGREAGRAAWSCHERESRLLIRWSYLV